MFNYFPKVFYAVNDLDKIRAVDITTSARIKKFVNSTRGIYLQSYFVQNGDRPDIVSTKVYDSPKYEYILLLVNDIQSVYDDWPRDYNTFNKYIEAKYGSIFYSQTNYAYYYTSAGIVVSEEYWQTLPNTGKYRETFYQYENRLNEEKAKINIVDFSYVMQFEVGIQELIDNPQ